MANKKVKKASPKKVKAKVKKAATPKTKVKAKHASLNDVTPEYVFHLLDGNTVKNLYELAEALENMAEDVFRFHVNEMKNDFAAWVKDVIKDDHLARELTRAHDKKATQIKVLKHITKCLK